MDLVKNELFYHPTLQEYGIVELGDFEMNYKPLSLFRDVLIQVFTGGELDNLVWDRKFFGVAVTNGIGPIGPEDEIKIINCKRFVQIIAGKFDIEIPQKFQDIIISMINNYT